jgi:arsenate reductase-like glutaredoxin family protein
LFEYFATKELHKKRLKEILEEFPKGWRKKIDEAVKKYDLELPV